MRPMPIGSPLAIRRRRPCREARGASPRRRPTASRAASAATLRGRRSPCWRRAVRRAAPAPRRATCALLPLTVIALIGQRVRRSGHERGRPRQHRRRDEPPQRARSRPSATTGSQRRFRPGAARARGGSACPQVRQPASVAPPSRASSASTSCSGSVPIDPAPSVITASPGSHDLQQRGHHLVESLGTTWTGRPEPRASSRRAPRCVMPGIGSSLARVDVGRARSRRRPSATDRMRPAAAASASSGAAETPRSSRRLSVARAAASTAAISVG